MQSDAINGGGIFGGLFGLLTGAILRTGAAADAMEAEAEARRKKDSPEKAAKKHRRSKRSKTLELL